MVALTWLRGLLAHRRARLASTALGVAVGVALLASIGTFLSATNRQMTRLATGRVPVDWQVEGQAGSKPQSLLDATKRFPGVRQALLVGFAKTGGLESGRGTVQRTGPGRVVGLPAGYASTFPGSLRTLAGRGDGVLLAQQTAANLHARPGDSVKIDRPGMTPARVKVDGVVELPAIDSLFQRVGAPVGAQPQAPPDNVILLPQRSFQRVEGPLAAKRPDLVKTQVHARSPAPRATSRRG
jgi:putative ABC transport system permease protein